MIDLQVTGIFVFILTPVSDTGRKWIDKRIGPDAQRWGKGIAVEHRYIEDIVEGARLDGLEVEFMRRSIADIANECRQDWRKPYFGAVPYLGAMLSLDAITDTYGADSAESVIAYFLSNATTWRGDVARRCKAELNAMLKGAQNAR